MFDGTPKRQIFILADTLQVELNMAYVIGGP